VRGSRRRGCSCRNDTCPGTMRYQSRTDAMMRRRGAEHSPHARERVRAYFSALRCRGDTDKIRARCWIIEASFYRAYGAEESRRLGGGRRQQRQQRQQEATRNRNQKQPPVLQLYLGDEAEQALVDSLWWPTGRGVRRSFWDNRERGRM